MEAGGVVHPLKMRSEDSKIYPGVAKDPEAMKLLPKECFTPYLNCPPGANLSKPEVAPYERQLAVYVPHGNDPKAAAPFIVLNDGMGYVGNVVPCLDTLVAEGREWRDAVHKAQHCGFEGVELPPFGPRSGRYATETSRGSRSTGE